MANPLAVGIRIKEHIDVTSWIYPVDVAPRTPPRPPRRIFDMTDTAQRLSIVIPAHNEAGELPGAFEALLASNASHHLVEIIVVSNGSRDGTAEVARGFADAVARKGWSLTVIDLPQGNKIKALNAGDRAARGDVLIYLDADVRVSPRLLGALACALHRPDPAYASGRLRPVHARSALTRAYTRLWLRVPFMAHGVPGCGIFAMNRAGRDRWGDWPDVFADDTFARLQFAPHERHMVDESYTFPVAEGLRRLVRVRRRQNQGVRQVRTRYPELFRNEDRVSLSPRGVAALALRDPLGFATYAGVSVAVRFTRWDGTWTRAR